MEMHHHLESKLDQTITKDDGTSSVMTESEDDPGLKPLVTFREKLNKLLHSHRFQVCVITLVIFDSLLVIGELMLDLQAVGSNGLPPAYHDIPHVLHYLSITVLSLFLIEIIAKLYAFRLEFFHHKMEIFDAIVVIFSFVLDIVFRNEESVANASGLIIILRLWRVVRILNGIVLSVKTQAEQKLHKERQLCGALEQELAKSRDYSAALEQEVNALRVLLKKHDIKELPPTIVENTSTTISVVAEVNHIRPND